MKQQRKCNDLTLRANDWKVGKKKKKRYRKKTQSRAKPENLCFLSVFPQCFAKHVYEIQKIPNPSLLMLLFSLKNIIFA